MVSGYAENIRLRATAEANQTNAPLKLTIASGVGDNTASTIFLNSKALNWPYDIRFTNEAGTELSFWREESDSEDGTWWVQIDSLTAKEISYIYLYYGKAGDSDADNGPNGIVTFYDDFETGDLSKWTYVGTDWTAQGTTKYEGDYAAQSIGNSMSYDLVKDLTPGCSVVIEAKVRVNKAVHQFNPFKLKLGSHSLNALFLNAGNFNYKLSTYLPDYPRYHIDTWYPIKIIIDNNEQVLRWEISGAWNVDEDPYIYQVALVDNSGNAIGASDFLTRITADWHTSSDSDDYGYIDYIIIYPYAAAKWLSPEIEEALADGLYVVERRIDYSLRPEETMRVMAYNDYDLEFIISKYNRPYEYSAGGGYAWTYTYVLAPSMLLEDTKHGVAAHYTDGELKCTFENTEDDTGKTIVDVTIAAFVSGRARTIFTYDSVDYYGTLSTKKHVAAWLETVYTTIPGTSDTWTFSDLGVFPVAGVDLRKTSSTEFPIIFGSEGDLCSPTADWETDPSMYFLDTICYCVKLLVHYYLDSDPSTILELEMFPESPLDCEDRLSVVHINPINNGDRPGDPTFGIVADVNDMPTHTYYVFAKFDPTYLSYVDGGAVKLALGLHDWGYPPYLNWKYRAYVQLDETKYYKDWVTAESNSTTPITWATNPATSAAWADGDLIEGDGCGVEIQDLYGTGSYMIYPALGGLYPIVRDAKRYDWYTLRGDLECTQGLWRVTPGAFHNFYLYYASAASECTLVGDMYMYDNVDITSEELYKRMESDLSELPPSFSQINGFEVTASVFAWSDDTANTYWRIFINVDGTRYYSDEYTTVGHPSLKKTESYSWDTNPATSAAWTYDDFQGIKYGVEVTRADKYDLVIFRPYELYADIDYHAIKGPLAPAYHRLPVIESTISITKNSNTPKFKADELRCVLPVGYYQPERTEIVLAKDGAHIFHGFIWQADERQNKETQILAKAQSHALACRYIPSFFYHARNGRWASVFSIADLFSDEMPIYPNEFGWMSYDSHDDEYGRWEDLVEGPFLNYPPNYPQIYQLWGIYNNIGIFFILNSMIPYGYAGDSDRYRNVAGLSYNRAKFLMSHNPSTIPKVENVGRCILDRAYVYHLTPWTEETGTWEDSDPIYVPDWVGSVKRFRQSDSAGLSIDEYAYSGQDVLVAHNPGVFMVLFDHALDTYLRPGEFELKDKYLAVPYVFNGSYASAFSDFFFRLGQEVWFRNSLDGYVYMDSGSELGRAATLQLMDGKNATVTKSVRDPSPAAVLGNDFQPRLSTDWIPARTWLTRLLTTQRTGEDLQEWVDLLKDEDKSTWTVKTQDKHWHILPGDHVLAQALGQGLEDVRVRKAVISNAGTTLTCGKRLYDLSEEWGQWRSVKGSTDADTDMPVQEQEIDLGNCDGSQTFVIKAEEYEIGSWKCKLDINWDLDVDEGYTADLASAPLGMFLVVKLNTKVVPPGRIQARGNSGSVELDLTDYCTCSTSSDQTNTVAIKLWRGVTSTNYRHKITGAITQYRRLEAVDNA